ncbi:response regulator transcription factor [Enterocloster citroniae]|uniref:Stage 0 sporulation protein A homolog n=4 Tax=Enterocloster citroniae TaxID=358743 RepID=A0ABV2G3M7_9FIRM|nr:response regulator [Enterocloster citroniae]KMW22489.1 hypothetical protein HMPREF9470_01368 [[Clostridium] citroniae WAL-19142]
MYKVMLVDDEDLEREIMAQTIPWEKVDMELVDMAWNGIEAMDKIRMLVPDIVITDIKMPVMDGIELIRRCQESYPHMMFVVLSGYGEYGYTSKAMELGIRHYILKPCNEETIVEVLLKVGEELTRKKENEVSAKEYQGALERMLPHVKEQILGELITRRQLSRSDEFLLKKFLGERKDEFVLFAVKMDADFDQLDRFALTNILIELMGGEQVIMSTVAGKRMIYLLPAEFADSMPPLALKVQKEFGKYRKTRLCFAMSDVGSIETVYQLYCQIEELYHLGEVEEKQEFLNWSLHREASQDSSFVVDYGRIRSAKTYGEILFEIYASYVKMEIRGLSLDEIQRAYAAALKVLWGDGEMAEGSELSRCVEKRTAGELWEILRPVIETCAGHLHLSMGEGKEEQRMKQILYAIYENLSDPELTLQYLAKEILFMNEDYFGRFFYKHMHEKYSAFLMGIRIGLARRLMEYDPEIRISDLAVRIGYPADGQYFAKVFKKVTGMVPSEYRNTIVALNRAT